MYAPCPRLRGDRCLSRAAGDIPCRRFAFRQPSGGLADLQHRDKDAGTFDGRRRVLAGDQKAVLNSVGCPVVPAGIGSAVLLQDVFDQKGNDIRKANGIFLGVLEAGHILALDQRGTIRGFDMTQDARRMANERHRLAGPVGVFDESDGIPIFGQIPEGPCPPG